MFCTKCGNKVSDDAQYCTKCGNKLNYLAEKEQNIMSNEELQARLQLEQIKIQQRQMQIQQQQLQIQQQQYNSMLKCPKCGSTSISANKKGYGVVKGGLGAIALGGATLGIGTVIGAGLGNIGRNKVICTCMNCGYKFKAGKIKR